MACRICGGSSTLVAHYDLAVVQDQWRRFGADTNVELRRCDRYGSYFTAEPPSPELIARQYDRALDQHFAHPGLDPARRAARCRALLARHVPASGVLADFGGGNGAFAVEAARAGYESLLIEIGAVDEGKLAAAGVRRVRSLDELPERSLDVLTLWDVYEHVWPHDALAASIRRVLKPSGRLVIEIPSPSRMVPVFLAMGRLAPSPRRENALAHICNYTHLQLMTGGELAAQLARLGFHVDHVEAFSELSYAGYEYARRFVNIDPLARVVGGLFDRRAVRHVMLGTNKTFAVARPA